MIESLRSEDERSNPLDLLEELISAHNWACERHSDSELLADIRGRWCDYHLYCAWQEEASAIFFSCHFDVRVPDMKRLQVYQLLGQVNEKLWLGHFDLLADEGEPVYRHTLPMRGVPWSSVEQLEDLVDAAIVECDRFYPALQLVVWGGKSVDEARAAAMMETVGEA